jgi:hypothetical protein
MRMRLPARSQTGRAVAGRSRAQSDSDLLRIIPPPIRARHIHICTSAHDSRFADQESGESSAASVTRTLRIFLFPRHPRCACREPFSEWKVVEGRAFYDGAVSRVSLFEAKKLLFEAIFEASRIRLVSRAAGEVRLKHAALPSQSASGNGKWRSFDLKIQFGS